MTFCKAEVDTQVHTHPVQALVAVGSAEVQAQGHLVPLATATLAVRPPACVQLRSSLWKKARSPWARLEPHDLCTACAARGSTGRQAPP